MVVAEPSPASAAPPKPAPRGWRVRLMATVLIGMAAGYLAARALGFPTEGVESAIVAGLTFSAGGTGRLRTALPVAGLLGLIVVAFSSLGAVTTGHPMAAALAMAFVAFTTTVLTAAKPVGLLIGMVVSYAYFLVSGVGVLAQESIGHDLGDIGRLGLLGLLVGLLLVTVRAVIEQVIGTAPAPAKRPPSPSMLVPILASLRTFDGIAKDGVRRAIALGLAMYAFQSIASHGAFWIMLTVFVILLPNGRSTVSSAIVRVLGTFVGVMGVVLLSTILPEGAALPLAMLALAASLAVASKSSTMSAAFGAGAASVLAGLPSGNIIEYAGSRLIDTLIGAALALAAGYLLWPRSHPVPSTVPADLTGTASSAGIAPLLR